MKTVQQHGSQNSAAVRVSKAMMKPLDTSASTEPPKKKSKTAKKKSKKKSKKGLSEKGWILSKCSFWSNLRKSDCIGASSTSSSSTSTSTSLKFPIKLEYKCPKKKEINVKELTNYKVVSGADFAVRKLQ